MAYYKLIQRNNNKEIDINVGEFIIRNSYTEKPSNSMLTRLAEGGYTTITNIGDSIKDKIGNELEEGAEFYFANYPNYYIKLENPAPATIKYYRLRDCSTLDIEIGTLINDIQINMQRFVVKLWRDNDSKALCDFSTYIKYESRDSLGNLTDDQYIPMHMYTDDNMLDSRIAFSFQQKQVGLISPYYYRFPVYSKPEQTIRSYGNTLNDTYGLVAVPHLIEFQHNMFNMPYSGFPGCTLSEYHNEAYILNNINTQTYADISFKAVITTVQGQYTKTSSSVPINSKNARIVYFQNAINILNMSPYQLFYDLLYDTESSELPYPPDTDPTGQSKPSIGGKPSGGDNGSDGIDTPPLPAISPLSTGAVNLYKLTGAEFREFAAYIWTDPYFKTIIKLFDSPMECVISLHLLTVSVPTSSRDNITIGNVTTDVTASIVSQNFLEVDFGELTIAPYYGDSSDYESMIEMYLPYYGYVQLNVYEVMDSTVNLVYHIDVLTGDFVAFIKVKKTVDNTILDSVLYQYNGNMAYQIPLSSTNYSRKIESAISAIGSKSLTPLLGAQTTYDRMSVLSSNVGVISIKQAYITINRNIHALPPNFSKYIGFPYEGYINLGSCSGYTKCKEVFINTIVGTPEETELIRNMLLEGIIF